LAHDYRREAAGSAICSLDALGHLQQLFGCSFGFVVTAAAQPHKYLLPI
jgi:hypothetical protein